MDHTDEIAIPGGEAIMQDSEAARNNLDLLLREIAICVLEAGHIEAAKVLIADGVDPSAGNQLAIVCSSGCCDVEVVKVLLADERVDPSAEDQASIRSVSSKGHVEVVKILQADKESILQL